MRLTYKNKEDNCYYPNMNVCSQFKGNYRKEIHNKLGQLEDIEEELGIDLITLFKALKNGIYYFTSGGQLTKDFVWLFNNHINIGVNDGLSYSFMTAFERQILLFQDYGKTWALTKEELE